MSTVTAVIVSYNTKDYLRRCIECLMASDIAQEIKITVVDNASSDGSAEMVAAEFPQAELICPGENLGFGRANNLALKKLDAPDPPPNPSNAPPVERCIKIQATKKIQTIK